MPAIVVFLQDEESASSQKLHLASEQSTSTVASTALKPRLGLGDEIQLFTRKTALPSTISPNRYLSEVETDYWICPTSDSPIPHSEQFPPSPNEPCSRFPSIYQRGRSTFYDLTPASYLSDVAAASTTHESPGFFSLLSDSPTSTFNSTRSSSNYFATNSPPRSRSSGICQSPPTKKRRASGGHEPRKHEPESSAPCEAGPASLHESLLLTPVGSGPNLRFGSPVLDSAGEKGDQIDNAAEVSTHKSPDNTHAHNSKRSTTREGLRTSKSQSDILSEGYGSSESKLKSNTRIDSDPTANVISDRIPQPSEDYDAHTTRRASSEPCSPKHDAMVESMTFTRAPRRGRRLKEHTSVKEEESADSASTSSDDVSSVGSPGKADGHFTSSDDSSAAPPRAQSNIVSAVATRLVAGWVSQYYASKTSGAGQGYRKHAVTNEAAVAPAEKARLDFSNSQILPSKRCKRKRYEDDDDDANNKGPKRGRKNSKERSPMTQTHARLLACPFRKYDPQRYSELNLVVREKAYRGCSSCYLVDISRLK